MKQIISLVQVFLSMLFAMVWRNRRVPGGEIIIDNGAAVIVRRANGEIDDLYRGKHKLKFGDTVLDRFSLIPKSVETNQEVAYIVDGTRVRLSSVYEIHISEPISYYQYFRKRKNRFDCMELNKWALLTAAADFSYDDFYNTPSEINEYVEQAMNDQLRDIGLRINNYRLDEVIWPETNEQWRRIRPNPHLRDDQYWGESRCLRPGPPPSSFSGGRGALII